MSLEGSVTHAQPRISGTLLGRVALHVNVIQEDRSAVTVIWRQVNANVSLTLVDYGVIAVCWDIMVLTLECKFLIYSTL